MFADPDKVALRRLKRRLKAGASLVVAVAAGAFLALRGGGAEAHSHRSPHGPDARDGRGQHNQRDGGVHHHRDAGTDAGTALVVRDGGAQDASAPQVDRHEHRHGMPVRDNLLE